MKKQLITEIKKTFLKWQVPAVALGISLIWYLGSLKYPSEQAWVMLFCEIEGTTTTIYLSMLMAAGAGSLGFCDDYENKYHYLLIMRGNRVRYTIAKLLVAAVTAFLIYVAGALLYTVLISLQMPAFSSQGMIENLQSCGCFGFLLPKYVWWFVIIQCIFDGLLCSILCCGALCFSIWVPNKFTVLCMPLVIFWLGTTVVTSVLKLPTGFDWDIVFRSWITDEINIGIFAAKAAINVLGYCVLFGVLMCYKVKRRYCYE